MRLQAQVLDPHGRVLWWEDRECPTARDAEQLRADVEGETVDRVRIVSHCGRLAVRLKSCCTHERSRKAATMANR
jgi:hypothetical protein